ncbi:SusC/RagA family TonB-linked outer membrane protein [Riemerella anatipestifer]|uniref:SusC/RagA family TonB-linked outer membrane protein n=1 Tax=Riemerella anatipestifer TaxID=34085 RepID=UPI00208FF5C3|nr:SusC/RagA family TonB-linked outer membrane protein [Riemerella anatipestifer]MCO4303018.1 SusC/RagA family TonB-linked outer membrane protein [Riemerella anatipestifer]MCO7353370.1 SusC/RagA family TonB-linked outer membrane protein [Riemerella anatipestifer]MCQ4038604.1 SusC/RagA family TonB-linked outer membrane protein [Riemerella anatipestifer]MCT6760147.1 SusC/RagA family TonB-linked outer membrane protein [Riemerella anatipestifer]MCT6763995.1 SusC/RagA family TonB-linked outer membr
MKKLTTSVLAVVLTSSFVTVDAQKVKKDSAKTTEIEGVVMTALGIKREKKAIGYAAQEVKGDVISSANQQNALSALSGNVAGVQVTAPSSMGGSSRILVRGAGSVTGDNRPLIVVDGVPLDNGNYNSSNAQRGAGGRDYGDATADINPDDIESVTVLKGGPAAALYGNRGGNGVILYTTKSAKRGRTELNFKTGISVEKIYLYPNLQKLYGGGSSDTFEKVNINGVDYNIADYATDESWGPRYDANLMYLPWYAFDPEFKSDYLKLVPWVSPKHDVDSFFKTGVTYSNSFSVSKSFSDTNVRLSYSNNKTEGIVPNSELKKNNLSFNFNSKLSDDLKVDGGLNYVLTEGYNRPEQGYSGNSVGQKFFQWGQRQLDMSKLRDYKLANGTQRSWNRSSWDNARPEYSDNPYWIINENISTDKRHRFFGNVGLTYNITDKLYFVGKAYGDMYTLRVTDRVAVGSKEEPFFSDIQRTLSDYTYEGRLHFDTKFASDFSLNSFIGASRRNARYNSVSGTTVGGLVQANYYSLANSVEVPRANNYESWRRTNSVFGLVSLGFKDMLFVEATGRNDWFSTTKAPVFYPSITGSFVFSSLFKSSWLSYGKIRAGWAKAGNDTDPYRLETYADVRTTFQGSPRYSNPNTFNDPNLKPEVKVTKEVGIEMRLLKNRIGFDVTLYDAITDDLITPLAVDPATGFAYKFINGGRMQNKGIEASVTVTPIKSSNFSWDITWNFAKNNNKLLSLYEDVKNYQITTAPFRAKLYAVVGETFGQIWGTDYTYDANGNKIIRADGLYKESNIKSLGSVIPDYNMGFRNNFRYKNFNLSFLVDIQKGGKYFSTSHMWGMYSGMLEESAANGIRENGIVLKGVLEDGSVNTKNVTAETYAKAFYNTVDAQNVFDASYIKLRDVTLSYDLPKNVIGPFKGVTVGAFARNLFAWGLDWKGMDPEMASYGSGNVQGIEGGSLPSTRTYGVNLQVKF